MGDQQIPILKDTKDPHYRYKMPKLTAKVEGSGNGIKTVITNMSAIARALGRPASYPTKYFGCELGAQVTMNNDYFVVNGSHDPEKLLNLLYGFIRKFVLCTKCNNPETTLTISGQNIKQKCIACGHETIIPKTIHKLTTYIINHPPDGSNPKSSKSEKKSKKTEKGSSSGTTAGTNDKSSPSKEDEFQDDFADDDFDDEALSSTAYIERMRDLCTGLNSGIYKSDSKESANLFYNLVKEKKESNLLQDVNVQKELIKEAERLDIRDKSLLVLSELLFSENIIEEIKIYRMLFLRFCNENRKAQKYLLGGFEKIVGDVYKDKLFNSSMRILKEFYDQDIIDEETIIEWSAKESKKYVSREMSKKIREKVAPFIKWLKEAEVEEDEDEDEEESEEETKLVEEKNAKTNAISSKKDEEDEDDEELLEFSHRVSGLQIESVKPVQSIKAVNDNNGQEENGEDDIDIDNI